MTDFYQGQRSHDAAGNYYVYDVKKGWQAADQASNPAYKRAIANVDAQNQSYARMKDQSSLLQQADHMLGNGGANVWDGKVDTGGWFNQDGAKNKSWAPTLSPDANAFDQTAKQIQSGIAPPSGQGAVSDYERSLFAAAAPSLANFSKVNKQSIAHRQAIINEQRDYANFLTDYVKRNGNDQGAQEVWQHYTQGDPYMGQSQDGSGRQVALSKDPDRWRRFIYGGSKIAPHDAANQTLIAKSAAAKAAPSGGRTLIYDPQSGTFK